MQQNLPDQQVNAGGSKNPNEEKQRREDVTNFEVSSKTTTTVSDGYSVKKLFIAVLINRARLVADLGDKANQAASTARSPRSASSRPPPAASTGSAATRSR